MKIMVLMGESGAGKDTIAKEVMRKYPNLFHKVTSYTTRPRRENEDETIYHFIEKQNFEFDDLLNYNCFNNWFYFTPYSALNEHKINLIVTSPQAAIQIQNKIKDTKVFYIFCPPEIRIKRFFIRENNPNVKEIDRRFKTDEEDFKKYLPKIEYETLVNAQEGDIDKCAEKIGQYVLNAYSQKLNIV